MDKTRDYGIDLLKVVAMFQIVLLHCLSHGALLHASPLSAYYETGFLLEALLYGAVNCFALASGYIAVNVEFKYRRLITLWIEVVFYCLLITVFFKYICPQLIADKTFMNDFTIKRALTPIKSNSYWYFTAYAATFFLAPFISAAMKNISLKYAYLYIATVIILFLALPFVCQKPPYPVSTGYNAIWLSTLYGAGGAIYKINKDHKPKSKYIYLCLYFVFAVIAWGGKYIREFSFMKNGAFMSDTVFLQYTSIPIFLSSVFLTLFFANITLKKSAAEKAVRKLSAASFAVYLIHVHPIFFRLNFWGGICSSKSHTVVMVLSVIGYAIIIFAFCIIIDILRSYLFKFLHIGNIVNTVCDIPGKVLKKVKNRRKVYG